MVSIWTGTGTCSVTLPNSTASTCDCNGWYHTGSHSEPRKPQKKNPFVLQGYTAEVILKQGRTAKKKESFKKGSQIVISRVGIIE